MVILLHTDTPGFINDISEEIRLFFDICDVVPTDCAGASGRSDEVFVATSLDSSCDPWQATATVQAFGRSAEYRYVHPAVSGSALEQKRHRKRCVKIAAFRALRKLFDAHLPWGSLTGIRPTRLYRELMEEAGEAHARRIFRDEFDVSDEKLALASSIVATQAPILETQSKADVGVYIGIPFCVSRCLYCSFASSVRTPKTDMEAYLTALKEDIRLGSRIISDTGRRVRSMYVGGGTPTVLTPDELDSLLSYALAAYGGSGAEFTVEAGRPDTITPQKLAVIKRLGVNRISINPQTMNGRTLELIGRSHTPEAITDAFWMARDAGFDWINMDVIAGLPTETALDMGHTLDCIAKLKPENLTVHTLALKRSSKLMERLDAYPLPDAATAERMVELGAESATAMGMHPYYMYRQKYMRGNLENVGYARPGTECIYNVDMMEDTTPIMAHGAGAMTKCVYDGELHIERAPSPKDIATYIAKVVVLAEEKRRLFEG